MLAATLLRVQQEFVELIISGAVSNGFVVLNDSRNYISDAIVETGQFIRERTNHERRVALFGDMRLKTKNAPSRPVASRY